MVARKECGYVQSITRIHDYGYTYDGRGNLIKEEEICSPTTQGPKNITIATYTYDETNKMVSGTNKNGEVSNYTFNGLGVRVGTEVIVKDNTHGYTDFHCQTPTVETGIDKPEVVLSDYVIDYTRLNIDQRVLVKSETDGYDFRYTYGLDLVNVKATGEGTSWWAQSVKKCVYSDYVHTDRLGSVVNLTDQYGRVPAQVDYDDWGKVTAYQSLNISGGYRTVLPEITYAGHQYDDVLGMYYAKARMYDAENRRFASVDPVKGRITEPMSMVQYLYVVDNPLRWVDLLGLEQVAKKEEGGIPQEPTIQSADELIATEIASTISNDTRSQLSLVAALFGTDGAFMVGFASGIVQAIEDFSFGNLVSLADHAKRVNTSLVSVNLQPQLYDSSEYERYVDSTNAAAEWLAKFTGHPDAFYAGRMIADALIQSFGIAAKYLGVGATAAGFTDAMKIGSAALLGAMVGGPGGAAIATASNLAVDMALAVGGAAVAAAGESVSQAAAGRLGHDSAKYAEYQSKVGCESGGSSLKDVYNSVKESPNYPDGFTPRQNGTTIHKVNNTELLQELRKVESGTWKKVYKDGYNAFGDKVSIHYFQSQSGKVFDVKVKMGWSN